MPRPHHKKVEAPQEEAAEEGVAAADAVGREGVELEGQAAQDRVPPSFSETQTA